MTAFLRRFLGSWIAAAGLAIVATIVAVALMAPYATPFDPDAQDIMLRLKPPGTDTGDGVHLLGLNLSFAFFSLCFKFMCSVPF